MTVDDKTRYDNNDEQVTWSYAIVFFMVVMYLGKQSCWRHGQTDQHINLMIFTDFAHINTLPHGPLARYVKLLIGHSPGMPGTFSPPPWVSDSDMHHDTCMTHLPWCMPGSLTSGFLWSRWRGKRPRHSRRIRNPQFYVSGEKPMKYEHGSVVFCGVAAVTSPRCDAWYNFIHFCQRYFTGAGAIIWLRQCQWSNPER